MVCIMRKNNFFYLLFFITLLLSFADNVEAYIGPGAGFAFISSFFILFITFVLAIFYFITWPFRFAFKASVRKIRRNKIKSEIKQVVVVGLDGMDPKLTRKFMEKGRLPTFQRLKEEGTFLPLSSSNPPISPVAWSSFMTGVDPSYHNIFDFFTRNPRTYLPMLSSAEIGKASKVIPIGKYNLPVGKPKLKLLRKSKPFWTILGENGVFSSVIRVPITFPPEKFDGVLLSGMCVPDLKGSQGMFSFYTTNGADVKNEKGGVHYSVTLKDNTIDTYVSGPNNSLLKDGDELKVPLSIKISKDKKKAEISVCRQTFELEPETYSPWIKITFRPGLGIKISGICRFYIKSLTPDFELYVTPINIDPEKPALPISHPFIYATYLSKLVGDYGTLGLSEDTWALNEGVIDETSFLKQTDLLYEEREKMFFKVLDRSPKGFCVCVFDTLDRVQHMFFRCLDKNHPANNGKETKKYENVIEDYYVRTDKLLQKVLKKVDDKTVVMVMSDYGFTQFKRGVNLNTWFFQNGYLALKDGKTISGDWFKDVDWKKTRAFSLALAGIFINRKGRESHGIVNNGDELQNLKQELIKKLSGYIDEDVRKTAIREIVDTESLYSGPYTADAPDLLVGYNAGYRTSWECATGRVTELVFEDNTRCWSGDHAVDPKIVPGVLFVNKKINTRFPDIKSIAPTIIKLFGIPVPAYMKGKPFI